MEHLKLQKTLLAVSAIAAVAGLLVYGQSHAANDTGQINFLGQIAASTCVLDLGDTASTSLGSKTINFGNISTDTVSGASTGFPLVKAITVKLSLKDSSGLANCALGTTKWDIGVNIPASQYSTSAIPGSTVLTNQAPSAVAAANIALAIFRSITGGSTTKIDFNSKTATYGTLLSLNSQPSLAPTDYLTLSAILQKSGTAAATPGAFSANLPLLVFYK